MQTTTIGSPTTRSVRPPRQVLLVISLLVVAVLGLAALRLDGGAAGGPAEFPRNGEIETRWGVRVTQVAVTADGGLVDFRFLVIDPDRALDMIQEEANLPVLKAEGGDGIVQSAAKMAPTHDLVAGRSYYILYRNTGGAIEPGRRISVVFDDLRLEHVVAQ